MALKAVQKRRSISRYTSSIFLFVFWPYSAIMSEQLTGAAWLFSGPRLDGVEDPPDPAPSYLESVNKPSSYSGSNVDTPNTYSDAGGTSYGGQQQVQSSYAAAAQSGGAYNQPYYQQQQQPYYQQQQQQPYYQQPQEQQPYYQQQQQQQPYYAPGQSQGFAPAANPPHQEQKSGSGGIFETSFADDDDDSIRRTNTRVHGNTQNIPQRYSEANFARDMKERLEDERAEERRLEQAKRRKEDEWERQRDFINQNRFGEAAAANIPHKSPSHQRHGHLEFDKPFHEPLHGHQYDDSSEQFGRQLSRRRHRNNGGDSSIVGKTKTFFSSLVGNGQGKTSKLCQFLLAFSLSLALLWNNIHAFLRGL